MSESHLTDLCPAAWCYALDTICEERPRLPSKMSVNTPVDDDSVASQCSVELCGTEDMDNTPKSEVPVALNIRTPGGTEQVTRVSLSATADDYFAASLPHTIDQRTQDFPPPPDASKEPNTTDSNVSHSGARQPQDAPLSLQIPTRPLPYTSVSSTSVETTNSAATVTTATSGAAELWSSSSRPAYPRPAFPNQAYSALHTQRYPAPYLPNYRQNASHTSHINTFASAIASLHASGTRSALNSPASTSSVGLYNPLGPPSAPAPTSKTSPRTYASPFLHFTHRTMPKETHVADVDVDPISGRKLINDYEIIDELGRGTHGKVKLGRDLNGPNSYVAIKIVERFSKRRKLGKLGTAEDKVKKEVAILKKARHPNIVALLEVIDDPSRKKVYIVLEWVEKGQIHWRTKGPKEIAIVEARRYQREKSGPKNARLEAEDEAVLVEAQKRLSKQKQRRIRVYRKMRREAPDMPEAWSMELAGDEESEESEEDRRSRISSATTVESSGRLQAEDDLNASQPPSPLPESDLGLNPALSQVLTGLEGTMYGAYDPTYILPGSVPGSRSSVKLNSPTEILDAHLDSELEYVPSMTIEQIRVAFRDTLLGLQYLHFQGIVHRDIKPPNLLATIDNRVKISDFGVSYLGRPVHDGEGEDISEHEARDLDDEAKELAKTVGTPAFYAPELCIIETADDPLPVTKAIDVWALGVTLFCMLFARTPFVDNEFVVMRQIADEEIYLPRKRLQPVESKTKSRPSSHGRNFSTPSSGRRDELDIVYEDIDDDLYDLLRRLLNKDPRKRITLEAVRHHPWVLADLPNQAKWLEETNIGQQNQGKKIEISSEELNQAVVPLQLLDRAKSAVKKITESLGLGKSSKNSRTRGQSSSSNGPIGSPAPSASPSTSAVSQEGRQQSPRADETIFTALKASRNGEHPLSKSVAVSPELEMSDRYFPGSSLVSPNSETSMDERDTPSRPNKLQRAKTVMSTTGSARTVRQSDFHSDLAGESPPSSPRILGSGTAPALPGGNNFSGLIGGASRIIKHVRERSTPRVPDNVRPVSDYGAPNHGDSHAEPSVALSQTSAAGQVNPPQALKDATANSRPHTSSPSTRPRSMTSSDRLHTLEPGMMSRMSSGSSISSIGRFINAHTGEVNRSPGRPRSRMAPESSAEDWKRADDERVRRQVRESQEEADKADKGDRSPISTFDSPASLGERTCPPSPDDHMGRRSNSRVPSFTDLSNHVTSAEASPTGPAAQLPPALVSSSSDLGSAVSMSISNPSIPSVISEASSIDAADAHMVNDEGEKRESSSDDTLNQEPNAETHNRAFDEGYGPDQVFAFNSDGDEEDSYSSDSDGGIIMGHRKPAGKHHSSHSSGQNANGDVANGHDTGVSTRSKKSSRSDSNNTMRKVNSIDNEY